MTKHQEVIAVLTIAATSTLPVAVELRSGQRFRDGVCEVYSSCGADFVTFFAHNRMLVDDITHCEALARRADPVA